MAVDIHKEDIPREFVNKTLLREKVSIWGIVQLLGHGAVDFSLMPNEIREKVEAELDRRHKACEQKSQGPPPIK
jgi:hypothetical protein